VRAGVLEPATAALMEELGLGGRMRRERLLHDGVAIVVDGERLRIDLAGLTDRQMTVYGQSEVMKDLHASCDALGIAVRYGAEEVKLHDLDTDHPTVTWREEGETHTLACDFVAGCDGFHGVSRQAIPAAVLKTFERAYPFGWLGVLADVPPCDPEVMYASHARGFALASMRSSTRSRYYVQCEADEDPAQWSDARFWEELKARFGQAIAAHITEGPSIEKSVAPLRSFVAEPMRWGRLFLTGDAAHIVPPTGAKGLNLAVADVRLLADALARHHRGGDDRGLEGYSAQALARVWKVERFSWWLTTLTHRFPDMDAFARRMQWAELQYLRQSTAAQAVFAENYVGLAPDG
jgi:p-hydroxybenzoate 3-monooxygenase